jgi:predicted nucleic acid-binding protein
MAWLLDTNVISELRKPKAEPKVLDFVSAAPLSTLYVSVVSLAEIRFGIGLVAIPKDEEPCRIGSRSKFARCLMRAAHCL